MLKTFILAGFFTLLAAPCRGAGSEGVSGGQFLRISAGARASALGEAGLAGSGAQSIFSNPAALSDIDGSEFSFSRVQWVMDINYSNAAIAKRVGDRIYALAVNYLSMPSIPSYDKYGNRLTDDYSAGDIAVALGYSRKLSARKTWGLDVKYISSRLEDASAKALAVDAGVRYAAIPGSLNLGFAAQNLGTRLKYISESDPLPFNLKFGGEYILSIAGDVEVPKTVSFFADANHMRDSGLYANFGVDFTAEYSQGTLFSVRGGYKTNAGSETGGLSAGFGVDMGKYLVDYCYSPMGDLGKAHRISLTLRFGETGK